LVELDDGEIMQWTIESESQVPLIIETIAKYHKHVEPKRDSRYF
jgi:hypothetical protein